MQAYVLWALHTRPIWKYAIIKKQHTVEHWKVSPFELTSVKANSAELSESNTKRVKKKQAKAKKPFLGNSSSFPPKSLFLFHSLHTARRQSSQALLCLPPKSHKFSSISARRPRAQIALPCLPSKANSQNKIFLVLPFSSSARRHRAPSSALSPSTFKI